VFPADDARRPAVFQLFRARAVCDRASGARAYDGEGAGGAVGGGRGAEQATEAVVEGGEVVEAGVEGDCRDRVAGAAQAHGGAVQARAQQVLVRRDADAAGKVRRKW
jgi:hypothetical protein